MKFYLVETQRLDEYKSIYLVAVNKREDIEKFMGAIMQKEIDKIISITEHPTEFSFIPHEGVRFSYTFR